MRIAEYLAIGEGQGKYISLSVHSLALTATDDRLFKRSRLDFEERRWNVQGANLVQDVDRYYYADPALQEDKKKILNMIRNDEFVMLLGAKASGKTTRLARLKSQLKMEYLCF
jgi:hypothetical protein